ncbi:ABC transporter permease [Angelakisella massiliensis]|uniref:ABC transporter permease n=1 Tax=Angelakisella massiliensis TaxID=1871018 RepID=UPI0008F948F2|nr:ABC transporter permease [Angelakisella massiliensis]
MLKYIIKRILLLIPVLIGVSFIVFTIMSFTPGDPATAILGNGATKEDIQKLNEELGYYDPFLERYCDYVINAVQGDFGDSYRSGEPVFDEIFSRFPTTIKLAISAIVLAVVIGIPIGMLSAIKQYSIFDVVSTVISMFMTSVPQFWLALMGILIFSVQLHILPSTGLETWQSYIMPVFTLCLPCAANIIRLTRSSMLETIRQDYVRTARAKGLPERVVIWKHAFRNALLPVITVIGINFGYQLGGAVLIESIFGIPGVGMLTVNSIRQKDIPQTTASILFLAFIYVVIMLVVDVLYAYVDPRLKSKIIKSRVKVVGSNKKA